MSGLPDVMSQGQRIDVVLAKLVPGVDQSAAKNRKKAAPLQIQVPFGDPGENAARVLSARVWAGLILPTMREGLPPARSAGSDGGPAVNEFGEQRPTFGNFRARLEGENVVLAGLDHGAATTTNSTTEATTTTAARPNKLSSNIVRERAACRPNKKFLLSSNIEEENVVGAAGLVRREYGRMGLDHGVGAPGVREQAGFCHGVGAPGERQQGQVPHQHHPLGGLCWCSTTSHVVVDGAHTEISFDTLQAARIDASVQGALLRNQVASIHSDFDQQHDDPYHVDEDAYGGAGTAGARNQVAGRSIHSDFDQEHDANQAGRSIQHSDFEQQHDDPYRRRGRNSRRRGRNSRSRNATPELQKQQQHVDEDATPGAGTAESAPSPISADSGRTSMPSASSACSVVCSFFLQGRCRRGAKCPFQHSGEVSSCK